MTLMSTDYFRALDDIRLIEYARYWKKEGETDALLQALIERVEDEALYRETVLRMTEIEDD